MIGRVAGRIDWKGADHVLIDVRGLGYIVHCSERTLAMLPAAGGMAALYTELLVREDLLQLFGFPTLAEKEWHRLLMSVQGVGAKAALAILGALGPDGVSRAIATGDWGALTAAKGVGARTAQRVVNELKEKAPAVMAMAAAPPPAEESAPVAEAEPVAAPPAATPRDANAQAEALSALTNLGYGPGEAAGAVAQAANETGEADTAVLIRAALRLLAPKG